MNCVPSNKTVSEIVCVLYFVWFYCNCILFLVACSCLFEASQILAELTARSKDRETIGKGIKITFSFGVFCFGLLFFRFFIESCACSICFVCLFLCLHLCCFCFCFWFWFCF